MRRGLLVLHAIAYAVLVVATIAWQVTGHVHKITTLGDGQSIYLYEYAKATYINTKRNNDWSVTTLKALSSNMSTQHKEMKKQLQLRHKDMANHVGEDIAAAQNALGKTIVDSQNQLGQGIVDAQNTLGNHIVDAQNADGRAIVDASNYVTVQHNKLSRWLYDSLCIMFGRDGGKCNILIGPLEEDQSLIPVELY